MIDGLSTKRAAVGARRTSDQPDSGRTNIARRRTHPARGGANDHPAHPRRGQCPAGIPIADLANETIVLCAPLGTSYYSDFLVNVCRRAGFEPQYRVVTSPPGPALGGVVTVVDIEGQVQVPMQGLWQPHTSSAVRDLILADR